MSTHITLTLESKLKVIDELESSGSQNFAKTARKYGVSRSAVSRLWKNREQVIKDGQECRNPLRKRKRAVNTVKEEDIESAFKSLLVQKNEQQARINAPLLEEKAQQLASQMGAENMSTSEKADMDSMAYNSDADSDLNGSDPASLPGIQVKFEVEDPEYDHSLGNGSIAANLLRSFPSLNTSSSENADQLSESSSSSAELRKITEANKSINSHEVELFIEKLLKNNECVLAKNDAVGLRPSRRGRNKEAIFPGPGQTSTFSVGNQSQGHISGAGSQSSVSQQQVPSSYIGHLMRPKSPTYKCAVQEKDRSHFNLALMESKVGSEKGEKIFRVQEHEMVCAVSSQTMFLNSEGHLVSSVDIKYYWCNFCNFSTVDKSQLMQHTMEHRFNCKHCRYQSFSRADVIHHAVHAHPSFKETANNSQYCTLLSDFLRVHNPTDVKSNSSNKRKCSDGGVLKHRSKVSRKDNFCDTEKMQKVYTADFDLFDVHVEKLEEAQEEQMLQEVGNKTHSSPSLSVTGVTESAPVSQTADVNALNGTSMPSSSAISPLPLKSTHPGPALVNSVQPGSSPILNNSSQPIITQVFSAATDPTLRTSEMSKTKKSNSSGFHPIVSAQTTSTPPTPLHSNSFGAGSMGSMHSGLYWSCAYCEFCCKLQSDIKEHSVQQHSGMRQQFIARLDEKAQPQGSANNTSKSDTDFYSDQIQVNEFNGEASVSILEAFPDNPGITDPSDEPPVLIKQEPMIVKNTEGKTPIRVRFPKPRNPAKDFPSLKCYHCSYTSRNMTPLRNHILNGHSGMCLVGIGGLSGKVFMCPNSDCAFRSSSGQTFIDHTKKCSTPDEDFRVRCLQATICIAEDFQTSASAASDQPSKVSYDQFSCAYMNCQFTSTKSQTKHHVLQCHGSSSLVIRNIRAHRNRKRSSVFFCRWCQWEGAKKADSDLHIQQVHAASQPDEDVDGEEYSLSASGEGSSSCIHVHNSDSDVALQLEPPDITHDERFVSACSSRNSDTADNDRSEADSAAEFQVCNTFESDDMPNLQVCEEMPLLLSPNPDLVSKEVTDAESTYTGGLCDSCVIDMEGQKKTVCDKRKTLKTSNLPCIRKKLPLSYGQSRWSSIGKSHMRLAKSGLGNVQCLVCRVFCASLGGLKKHMRQIHNQNVSFSFRSVYHSSLRLKCKFYACPRPECFVYRYNEADVVKHYRKKHNSHPHPYLNSSYTPALRTFLQKCNLGAGEKVSSYIDAEKKGVSSSAVVCRDNDGSFLCLYCDCYFYADSLQKMKAHHVSVHPGMPIIIRDVVAYKNKKVSRMSVCNHTHCDFTTLIPQELNLHASKVHGNSPDQWTERSFQCTSCGWITTDESVVHEHVVTMHALEGGSTVVTLDHDNDQHTVEEKYISV